MDDFDEFNESDIGEAFVFDEEPDVDTSGSSKGGSGLSSSSIPGARRKRVKKSGHSQVSASAFASTQSPAVAAGGGIGGGMQSSSATGIKSRQIVGLAARLEQHIREVAAKAVKEPVPDESSSQLQSEEIQHLSQLKGVEMDEDGHINYASAWPRKSVRLNTRKDPLVFQQLEVLEGSDPQSGDPEFRMFGVTREGNSAMLRVRGFRPYFYAIAPLNSAGGNNYAAFKQGLEAAIRRNPRAGFGAMAGGDDDDDGGGGGMPVVGGGGSLSGGACVIDIVPHDGQSIYGYSGNQNANFVKIIIRQQRLLGFARQAIERGEIHTNPGYTSRTFESNLEFVLRFMVDCNINGASWIEVPAGKYSRVVDEHHVMSTCQIEAIADFRDVISHDPADSNWSMIAPLRILSFDIECAGRKGIFPEPEHDPVIQIANMVTVHGEDTPFIRNIFNLKTCAPITGTHVLEFANESDMLKSWREFVEHVDPDIIIGYNTANFDIPYLIDRATELRDCENFPYLGRLRGVRSKIQSKQIARGGGSTGVLKSTNMNGRVHIDMYQVIQKEYKLRSFKLNAVCQHFLKEQKEDVHHSIITELHNNNDETRRRLALYCLKDAYLPQRLMDKLMTMFNYVEMARVMGLPMTMLFERAQEIRVISQLYRHARRHNVLIPTFDQRTDETFQGAHVLEPIRGYYEVPIATLDFASLYPSIIMARNLCYSTLINDGDIAKFRLQKDVDFIVTPTGDRFVTAAKYRGVLPQILEDLLAARKRARAMLKEESDPFKKACLNGRQLALKVTANSVYGFTGFAKGRLPCLAISSSVTAFGREMINIAKSAVESKYSKANGHPSDAVVIYGDTDSVMINFGMSSLEETMRIGKEAAEYVTSVFNRPPIKLEFEKVYWPYLLINKKRYAGLYWTRPDKFDKLDTKGLETVRRDNCPLVPMVLDRCMRLIFHDRDKNAALNYVKSVISDLLQNKIDIQQLIISKELTKTETKTKQAHMELAEKMRKRDPGSAPQMGDRIPYVIIKGAKGTTSSDNAEDPLHVLDKNLSVDTRWYLDHQLAGPLVRLFEPILGASAEDLLTKGSHTRAIHVSAPSASVGIMKFASKTVTCLGCKSRIPKMHGRPDDRPLCDNCMLRAPEIYRKFLTDHNVAESRFGRCWTQCQRCQGSLHQDVICSSNDCPIFYMRRKAQTDADESSSTLVRFDELW
ncbi:DNA polymerase delta subunit 1 [Ramicandelaber brevisporus]|nr:DNA polymerase delta subunit 1 [Ramicandelaber brevisporus]